jgi:hypothetical protein
LNSFLNEKHFKVPEIHNLQYVISQCYKLRSIMKVYYAHVHHVFMPAIVTEILGLQQSAWLISKTPLNLTVDSLIFTDALC